MDISTNYGFFLPSRDTDDIADINKISDNFRIIDGKMVDKKYLDTILEEKFSQFVNVSEVGQ